MEKEILASVCMLSYNHEKYIKKAIEGVINQKTNFNFELLIHDDASQDNTANIIRSYEKKHPNIVKPIYQTSNQFSKGVKPTFEYNFPRAKGRYLAICEGDDFWTDKNKLQKQVDFLEKNKDFQVCFTNTSIVDGAGLLIKQKSINNNLKTIFEHKDMPIYAPALTRVFRNITFPKEIKTTSADKFILVYQSKIGKIKFLNEVTAAYRQHNKGIWSGNIKEKKIEISINTSLACLELLETYMYPKYYAIFIEKLLQLKKINKKSFEKNRHKVKKTFNTLKKEINPIDKCRIVFLLFIMKFNITTIPHFIYRHLIKKNILKLKEISI